MLSKLAALYLKKRKKSVLIGYEVKDGSMRSLNNENFMYDNSLVNVEYKTRDGNPMSIPEGKFSIERPNKQYTPQTHIKGDG